METDVPGDLLSGNDTQGRRSDRYGRFMTDLGAAMTNSSTFHCGDGLGV